VDEQLVALASVHELLDLHGIDYWLFGGWAVDFYVGSVTRLHDDVDIAVWLVDHERIAALLVADGWMHAPEPDEDGGTGYERNGVRLELTFLVRDPDGTVFIPLRSGRAVWSPEAFGQDVLTLNGVRARVIDRDVLARGKARTRDDSADAAKDVADFAALSQP
jgi:Aminoglycoside-2''-adenylyltransferase